MTHKLQTRYCKKCGSSWRCLPTSTSQFCSITHQFNIKQHAEANALRHRHRSRCVLDAKRKIKEMQGKEKTAQEIADYLNDNAYNPIAANKTFTAITVEMIADDIERYED